MKFKGRELLTLLIILVLTLGAGMEPVWAAGDTTTVKIDVKYEQTMARDVVELVNAFRAEEGLWCWSANAEKVSITSRGALTYDYQLEQFAMQRAAELALRWDHTRPNDQSALTAWGSSWGTTYYAYGENIAVGYTSAQAVFNGWREEDEPYSGQGHRRNMLGVDADGSKNKFTSIGMGCVYYNGTYYWAMELGKGNSQEPETDPVTATRSVDVEVNTGYLEDFKPTVDNCSVKYQETIEAPEVSASITQDFVYAGRSNTVSGLVFTPEWEVEDPSIASISDGVITGKNIGTTKLKATVNDTLIEVGLKVECGEHVPEVILGKVATCTEPGLTKGSKCSVCGEILEEQTEIPATGHTEEIDVAIKETCTEPGKTEGKHCSVCNEVLVRQEVIPAKGHTEVIDAAVEETCTEPGKTEGKHCSVCGEVLKAQEVIPAKGHTEVIDEAVAATCTESGKTEGSHCSVCGEVLRDQEVIPANGHKWDGGTVIEPATCSATGLKQYICTVCQDTRTEVLEKTAHTPEVILGKEATCTEDGLTEGSRCAVCGEILKAQETISATGHKWDGGAVTKEATCTEEGIRTYTCTKCGATKTEPIAKLPHSWNDGSVTSDATCTVDGEMTYECAVCGITHTTPIKATGHTPEKDEGFAATCTEDGLTDGSHCSVCNEVLEEQETIPALGHSWDEGKVTKEPSCTESGEKTYTCTVCGSTKTEPIAMTGHSWDEGKVTKEPTCTEAGEKTYTCTACGDTKTEPIAMTGHSWDEGKVTKEPTCTETGEKTYTCTACGETKAETIASTGHTEGALVKENVVAATDTSEGSYDEVVYCTVCGEELSRNTVVIAALEKETTRLIVENGIQNIPDTLIQAGFGTESRIMDEMHRVLTSQGKEVSDREVLYDVVLQVSKDNGQTWELATKENFPENGLTVELPYPEGTNKNDYEFTVLHMFTIEMNGHAPGEVEYPAFIKTDTGLQVTFSSLSPVYVTWEKIAKADEADKEESHKGGSSKHSDSSENSASTENTTNVTEVSATKVTSAKTGDDTNVVYWVIFMALSVAGIAAALRKKQ